VSSPDGQRFPVKGKSITARHSSRHFARGQGISTYTHVWPTHHENVHFYGTQSVDIDGELAQLDADGYRPLRLAAV
jgi:hypothetical protein